MKSGKQNQKRTHCRAFSPSRFPAFRFASRRLNAFTLIELMTVIVIIAIMTAMIIPEMRGTYEDALLRSTSRDLVSVFELASSRAISLNQLHRVRMDRASGKYLVERETGETGLAEFVPLTDVSGCAGELDKRITLEIHRPGDVPTENLDAAQEQMVPDAISFYSDGTADAATILLRDRSGFSLGLRLNAITARVHVFDLATP